jgi:hypothetical protein
MAPVQHFIGAAASTVAMKIGDSVVAHIPTELLARFAKLPDAVKSKFLTLFRSGKTGDELVAETEKLLKSEGVITDAEATAGLTIRASQNGLNEFSRAWQYGFQPYGKLSKELSGTGLAAHHLLPKRFAKILGMDVNEMASIALTKAEHDVFTQAWRDAIPYGAGTDAATRSLVYQKAREIYKNYPEILRALGL